MKSIPIFLAVMLLFAFAHDVYAEDNSCRLAASLQDDVWVIVYDADAHGNRGKIIWKGKIAAGQEIEVTSTDGHIRYDYTHDKDQPYEGDVAVGCYQKNKILVE
jgi:hypothetical protein